MTIHILFTSKYKYTKSRLLELGFNVKERANELIDLILDEDIDILMLVIGGYNSANLLSNLDFDKIKILKNSLCIQWYNSSSNSIFREIYGVSLISTFGEYHSKNIFGESRDYTKFSVN